MNNSIRELFNDIAPHYDFLNHLLSFNIDKRWRKKSLKNHITSQTASVLDIACGTGDYAIESYNAGAQHIIGLDVAEEMVLLGRQKIDRKQLTPCIDLQVGDCANLPFKDESFDAITVAYGVRNFELREQCLHEMYKVLKNNGELIILEFSIPSSFLIKKLYGLYFKKILPFVGKIISGNRHAYKYLPNSVYDFPDSNSFVKELQQVGFNRIKVRPMTFGITTVYYACK